MPTTQVLPCIRGCVAPILVLGGAATFPLTAVAAGAPPDGGTLEELVVTAQRRSEDLQETGVAASVLSGDDLVDKSVFGLTALQYAAPSVTISDYGSANVFNIRGIGRSQVDVDLPSGVVIYRDGAPTLAGYFQNEPYFDMASVEVLRGPQGTFVGKSAAGGAVFLNTRNPELGAYSTFLELGAGSFDQGELTGAVNVPVSETLALRFAYHHLQRNDYYDHIRGDFTGEPGSRNLHSGRASALWVPNDRLDVLLKVDVSDLDFGGNVTSSFGDPLFDVDQNADFDYTDKSVRTVLNVGLQIGAVQLRSVTGYQDVETTNNLDLNGTEDLFYQFSSHGDVRIVSQELNLISPDDAPLRWVLGAFYQKQEIDIPGWEDGGFTFTGGPFQGDFPWIATPWDRDDEDWAVFGQLSFNLTESLELDIGARYSDYQLEQFTQWVLGDATTPPFVPLGAPGGDSHTLSEDAVDGKVGLNWTVDDDHFVYALVSRGHVTGGVNVFPPFLPYDEMEVFNYEAGWKADWSDGRLRTQFNGFYQTFDDYQAQFAETGPGLANIATFRNAAGESDIFGFELSGQAVVGNWGFDFGAAWLESELGTFRDVIDPFTLEVVDLTGAESPFAPDFTLNVGVEYTFRLARDLTLRPRLDYAHISETQAGLWGSQLLTLESRDLLNVQLRLAPAAGNWYANFWMTNATDEKYAGGIQNNGTLRYAAPPRQYGLRVGLNL